MIQQVPGFETQLYNPDVIFTASPVCGGQGYKECQGCHNISTATDIRVPETLYYDGKQLSTKYHHYWLCLDCVRKLKKALEVYP